MAPRKTDRKKSKSRVRRPTNVTISPLLLEAAAAHYGLDAPYRSLSHLIEESLKERLARLAAEHAAHYGVPPGPPRPVRDPPAPPQAS